MEKASERMGAKGVRACMCASVAHCLAFLVADIGGAAAKLNAFIPCRMEAAAPAAGGFVEPATVTPVL